MAVVVESVVLRFMVGRSGSSAGGVLAVAVEVVVEVVSVGVLSVVLSDLRFIVGRSGSSAGVLDEP